MHLTIFGSTGGTGQQLLRAAVDAGHTVTAIARDPSRISTTHSRLNRMHGDVLDPSTLDGAVNGSDAVLSALGVSTMNKTTTVYSAGVANILEAMRPAGVRRFIAVSALPVTPRADVGLLERRMIYPMLYRFFGEAYADMKRMEQVLDHSDVDWTVLRPPMLTDKPATGRYRTAMNQHLAGARKISRADLADAMLHLLDKPDTVRATVGIAY